jgi:tetratricopeptide (TPR) repeat protein
VGNPVSYAGDRVSEFLAGEPDLTEESNRFTFNAGSNRSEVWRVAIDAARDDPIFGEGGGGFQFRYNREREDPAQLAKDAHSVELEMLSELGIVGLALFAMAICGGFAGAIRARRLGPAAAHLSCGALAAAAYWLTHASIDWFWPYPAVTAPVFALLGAAAAPALIMPERMSASPLRRPMIAVIAVFVVTLIPPFLSESLVQRAFDTFRSDTEQAYADLDAAKKFNPLSDMPALTEGSVALALEDRERAIEAFREAIRKRPEEYVGHFFLALVYADSDPAQARSELAVVAELNPLETRIRSIQKKIERTERREER